MSSFVFIFIYAGLRRSGILIQCTCMNENHYLFPYLLKVKNICLIVFIFDILAISKILFSLFQPPLFIQYPLPREYTPEKPIKSMHKKQNDVWRFLTDTRHGLHDIGWLNHCRKAVRTVLMSGEDIKVIYMFH